MHDGRRHFPTGCQPQPQNQPVSFHNTSLHWQAGSNRMDLAHSGLIMGILNVTPDSFSDGGSYSGTGDAVRRGIEMLEQGANIIDIGGESTRPGAKPVPADEEKNRILPVIRRLRTEAPKALLSVDTMKAEVARAALDAGVDILNDVSGFSDPEMQRVGAESSAGLIVMHMKGTPLTMQHAPDYTDVVAEVARALHLGIRESRDVV